MSLVNTMMILLGSFLAGWGVSLLLRLLAVQSNRLAKRWPWTLLRTVTWGADKALSKKRIWLTALLGMIAVCSGLFCFVYRHKLNAWEEPMPPGDIVASAATGVLLALGFGCVLLGLTADQSRGRKRCPKCWYDMSGAITTQCSECGHKVTREQDLFRTRKSGTLVITGLLIATLAYAPIATRKSMRGGMLALTPTWVLVHFLGHMPSTWLSGRSTSPYPDEGTLEQRLHEMSVEQRIDVCEQLAERVRVSKNVKDFLSTVPVFENLLFGIEGPEQQRLRALSNTGNVSERLVLEQLQAWQTESPAAQQKAAISTIEQITAYYPQSLSTATHQAICEKSLLALRADDAGLVSSASRLSLMNNCVSWSSLSVEDARHLLSISTQADLPASDLYNVQIFFIVILRNSQGQPNSLIQALVELPTDDRREFVVSMLQADRYASLVSLALLKFADTLEVKGIFTEMSECYLFAQSNSNPRNGLENRLVARANKADASVRDILDVARAFRCSSSDLSLVAINAAKSDDAPTRLAAARYLITTMMNPAEAAAMQKLADDIALPEKVRRDLKNAIESK